MAYAATSARRQWAPTGAMVGMLGLGAIAVGALAVVSPLYAIALVAAVALIVVVAADIGALPVFLVFTMFVESVSLGPGLRIGRVAGAMALAVVLYYLLARGRANLRGSLLLGAAVAYGLWIVASVYWASAESYVVTTALSWVLAAAYLITMAVLVRSRRQLGGIFWTLAGGSLLFGGAAVVTYAASGGGTRAAGLQGDPNFFAVYQVIALPAALVVLAGEHRPQRRLLLFTVIGVIVLSVVASQSRTGLVALSAAVVLTLVLPYRLFFRAAREKLGYVFALLVGAGLATAVASTSTLSRLESIFKQNHAAGDRGSGRTDLWAAALHGWHEHAWFGLGAGNFQARALDLLTTTPGVDTRRNYVAAGRVVHNAYLETLTELGVIGLALYLLVIALTATFLVRASRRARAALDVQLERFAAGTGVGLAAFCVSSIFLSNELGKPLWIFAGLALALDVMTRDLRALAGAAATPEGPDYDLDVREQLVEQLERRVAERMKVLLAEQEKLARRHSAVTIQENEVRRRLHELQDPPGRAEAERATAQAEDALRARTAGLESRARELDERERALDARMLELEQIKVRERIEGLEREREELTAAFAGARTELGRLWERVAVAEQERDDLGHVSAAVEVEAVRLRGRCAVLGRERDESHRAAVAAETEAERLRARVDELELVCDQVGSAASSAAAEVAQLRDRVDGLERERDEARKAAAATERQLHELRDRVVEGEREATGGAASAATEARTEEGLAAVAQHERELARPAAVDPATVEPASDASMPVAPAASTEGQRAVTRHGSYRLETLERLVDQHAPEFPDRVAEWQHYLFFLRSHADTNGRLLDQFDDLIEEVFGELLA